MTFGPVPQRFYPHSSQAFIRPSGILFGGFAASYLPSQAFNRPFGILSSIFCCYLTSQAFARRFGIVFEDFRACAEP